MVMRGVSRRDRGTEGRDGVWALAWTVSQTFSRSSAFRLLSSSLSATRTRYSSLHGLSPDIFEFVRMRLHVRELLANGWLVGGVGASKGGGIVRGSVARVHEVERS